MQPLVTIYCKLYHSPPSLSGLHVLGGDLRAADTLVAPHAHRTLQLQVSAGHKMQTQLVCLNGIKIAVSDSLPSPSLPLSADRARQKISALSALTGQVKLFLPERGFEI